MLRAGTVGATNLLSKAAITFMMQVKRKEIIGRRTKQHV
jgi:hypothetical protein